MAGQQQQILDTIFSMKRRLMRDEDSSDADESDTPYNHRKQSLKRKAQYTRSGKAVFPSDPPPYKKRITHAGYSRYILHRNPAKFDPDGDIIEPGDEYEDEDELSAVEEDPYADIKLEELLAPLTSAADLPNHAGYSQAYTSKHLTNLTREAGAISRKEQITLAAAKRLFTKLTGDPMFVPLSVEDLSYGEGRQNPWVEPVSPRAASLQANGRAEQVVPPEATDNGHAQEAPQESDVTMDDAEHVDPQHNGDVHPTTENGDRPEENKPDEPMTNGASSNRDISHNAEDQQNGQQDDQPNGDGPHPSENPDEDASDTASQHTSHRMTTRGRAHAQAPPSPSPPPSPGSVIPPIHPLFTYPTSSLPDRDLGLPFVEAEHTRQVLLFFIQRQEEIANAAKNLYEGLLRGERMRHEVYSWSKAEAHVGEMSDGEDWYDKEWWGLTEDLAKGKDEEEEDTQVQGKKSTRQRRTKDKEDR